MSTVVLGAGERLLDEHVGRLERTRVVESPSGATHLRFSVPK